jgi:menaquinone-specific isochorismate synthase
LEAFEEKISPVARMPYRKKTYIGFVADLQHRFRAGELRKCVPVLFEYARQTLSPGMVCSLLLNLVRYAKQTPVNLYGFWGPGQGIVGATPEVLFEIPQTGMLRTMALASTQPSAARQQLLFKSKKQRNEHHIVVESIVRSLKPHGFVSTGTTTVLNLPNLTHLLTPIELQFSDTLSFLEAVQSLHPTPALGGEPRGAAWQWLKGLQKYGERRRFGAPFGVITEDGFMRCLVAIRGIQWSGDFFCFKLALAGVLSPKVTQRLSGTS